MNRSRRPISASLGKKKDKTVRNSQTGIPIREERKYSDELTTKEMLKKYPRKVAKKTEEIVMAMGATVRAKKGKAQKKISKRTTPGYIPSDSTPAYQHREGQRWIKTLNRQASTQRKIDTRRGRKK